MKNTTWTITIGAKTLKFEQDFDVENGSVAQEGTTMSRPLNVFLDGLEKMKQAGAVVVVGAR
jgi:hypothetical protein